MGGKLTVESGTDWGTRFSFEVALPVGTADAVSATAPTRRVLGYEGPRRRVLAVDGNAANRGVMAGMLAPLGFEIAEAETGEAALALAPTFRPDLVLMD